LLLTILSWAISEFLAGCAAYAEAMYPTGPLVDDPREMPPPAVPDPGPGSRNERPFERRNLTVISNKYVVERRDLEAAVARETRSRR
jgi:hypothetical protein